MIAIILTALGISVSVAIAFWQHAKARLADARLQELVTTLPEKLLTGVREVITRQIGGGGAGASGWSEPGGKSDGSPWLQTRYADLNGDGRDELLVEVPSGPHSSVLLVYSTGFYDFDKVAELATSTPNGFEVAASADSLVVETVEVALRPGLPYVYGLRDRVTHRLVGREFVEVGRVEGWTDSDVAEARDSHQ